MTPIGCLVVGLSMAGAAKQAEWASWPPREHLLETLVDAVPKLRARYHPATGKFGAEPWVYQDQMPIFPLAAAWAIRDEQNPFYHDSELLKIIGRGGEVWLEQQYEDGRWRLLRKNGDDWGKFHSSFVQSHWVKTYHLVGAALPEPCRQKWELGLTRSLSHVPRMLEKRGVHNQPLRHAMALYIGGVCFDKRAWREAARAYMAKAAAAQDPAGFWTEHSGPAVAYDTAYLWFLGIYHHFSRDPVVLGALERAARFHSIARWPDGSLMACIDERTLYSRRVHIGNVGFTFSAPGRAFLLDQLRLFSRGGRRRPTAEYAANMLLYGVQGQPGAPPALADKATIAIGDDDTLIRRHAPWQWALAGYTCKLSDSRWIQDRQNLIDVFHNKLGLVVGGGNTKLQPYWSTFTVGEPSLLTITPGQTRPDFTPEIDLQWTPDQATLTREPNGTRMTLQYGSLSCRARVSATDDGRLKLTFAAPVGRRIQAHVPLLRRAKTMRLATGVEVALTGQDILMSSEETGGHVVHGGLKVHVPPGARLRWPARLHNPYRKDGSAGLSSAKLVLVLPFDQVGEHTITLSHDPDSTSKR